MKFISMIALGIISTSTLSAWALNMPEIFLNNGNRYDLTTIASNSVNLRVNYSGPISGLCGIQFSNDMQSIVGVQSILDELNFSYFSEQYNPVVMHSSENDIHTAVADLLKGRFVANVFVTTKTGINISDMLTILETNLVVSAVPCD